MPVGVATPIANSILALMLNGTTWTGYTTLYAQLHVGQPGAAGTANIAGENTRVSCGSAPEFGTPAGGSCSNNNALTWTAVNTNETYTNVSLWTALTGGTFVGSGSISAQPVVVGNNFSIPVGGLTVALPVAS
jgi:hypothetical protein